MNGVFLAYGNREEFLSTGVGKKVSSQIALFNKQGLNCELMMLECQSESGLDKVLLRLPFTNKSPKWVYDERLTALDFIYLRRPEYMTGYMISVLRHVKENNPTAKILLEIPTYPYDKEIEHREDGLPLDLPFLWRDRFWRKRLGGCVDRIVVLNRGLDELWGIPTLRISNGIDMQSVGEKTAFADDAKCINLIAVAMFKEWHGYERIIRGLSEYYGMKADGEADVHLYLVGEGPELPKYKNIVTQSGLEPFVHFCGFKSSGELDQIYGQCHIGLASFGGYKINLSEMQNLKSREYLAKGIPVVSGCSITELKNEPFYLQFENTDSTVDIGKVVSFYRGLRRCRTQQELAKEIRGFAEEHVSVESGMRDVVEYLKKR